LSWLETHEAASLALWLGRGRGDVDDDIDGDMMRLDRVV